MPTVIYDVVELQLSDGKIIKVQPLKINRLKKFLEVVKPIQENPDISEAEAMEVFIKAGMLCMQQFYPELSEDQAKFEDTIEVPTLMKILEVAGGLKLNNDPNFPGAELTGNL